MTMHAVHSVHFNDKDSSGNDRQTFAIVTKTHDDGTKDLAVFFEGQDGGLQLKKNVPHGSTSQGVSYSE